MSEQQYDNTNKGVLFKNNKKSEKHPDFKGNINIDGAEWEIAGWERTAKSGNKFLSLKVNKPYKKEEEAF